MTAAFRVDSSREIGRGHIARSLNIARELRSRGHKVFFICRGFEFGAAGMARADGFEAIETPLDEKTFAAGGIEARAIAEAKTENVSYSAWLGVSAAREIGDLTDILRREKPDWLIFDSYAIGAEIEGAARKFAKKIAAIDDLANRKHDCDLLIDPLPARSAGDYADLVPANCETLLGSRFAPISPAYAKLRSLALPRRYKPRSILISMGGIDLNNLTQTALKAIAKSAFSEAEINVVLSSAAPEIEDRKLRAKPLKLNIKWHIETREMADIILRSDMAVGAMGSNAYERAALGLCSIGVLAAENQLGNFNALKKTGAIIAEESIEKSLKILDENIFRQCERSAFASIDGKGVERICERLENGYKQ